MTGVSAHEPQTPTIFLHVKPRRIRPNQKRLDSQFQPLSLVDALYLGEWKIKLKLMCLPHPSPNQHSPQEALDNHVPLPKQGGTTGPLLAAENSLGSQFRPPANKNG